MPDMEESSAPLRSATAVIRRPALTDAAGIHQLVIESGALDVNSCYLYLLLCRDFSATCRVAEMDGHIIGFVTAYHPPGRPGTLFIWQIAVKHTHRGQGMALRLLLDLLASVAEGPGLVMETTISQSNLASQRLFASLARRLRCHLRMDQGFDARLFAPQTHASEKKFLIGPVAPGLELSA
jgi:diaminobutyrate acetyltransferase